MEFDVIVVGAGASGLTAAIAAARMGNRVLIIEQKEKAGKKILATGNGKCNYTNVIQTKECYRSNDSDFAMKVLSSFDVNRTVQFFKELGIYPKNRNGYLYPYSEQASSIVQVLLMECDRLGIVIHYEEKVKEITLPNFTIITVANPSKDSRTQDTGKQKALFNQYYAHRLILATGGCASPKLGSDGSGYQLARLFGHTIITPVPALVQLKTKGKYLKTVSGVRTIARIRLYSDEQCLSCEEGELIFTDYGVSGIPIFQTSRYAAKALKNGQQVELNIDFLYELPFDELVIALKDRIKFNPNKSIEQMLVGLLNHKLAYVIIQQAGLDPLKASNSLSLTELDALVKQIKSFQMTVIDTNSFENAQVCAGGVSTRELHETMESKLQHNLYLIGELVDVDGTCGGYNLQWAWSSGYVAGHAAGAGTQKNDRLS